MEPQWKIRIRQVLDERFGGNKSKMSKAAGMNLTWARDVLAGKEPPRANNLKKLADATGHSVEWYLGDSPEAAWSSAEPYDGRIAGSIPQIDAEAGAGNGNVGEVYTLASGGIMSGHRVVEEWVIPRGELGVEPSRVIVLPVTGTSMVPTLNPGDKVMVDTGSTGIKHGEIYVLDEGDGPIVKRARVLRDNDPVMIEIISENPSLAPIRRPAELVRVIGRVIGKWTRM
jgi:phage repressor protein C with HTH and peptisase S24 domain